MNHHRSSSLLPYLALSAVVLGILLRLFAALTDLWLDELWSLGYALNADSAFSILWKLKIDNNHIFNTLYLYGIGSVTDYILYRIPSFAAGCLTLIVLYKESGKTGDRSLLILSLLLSISFLMVLYASEARGYSVMMMALVILLILLQRYHQNPLLSTAFGIWVYVFVGLISQFSFALFLLAAPVWSAAELWARFDTGKAIRHFTLAWLIPLIFSASVYWFYIIQIPPGSGYLFPSSFEVILNALLALIGFPPVSPSRPDIGAGLLFMWLFAVAWIFSAIYSLYKIGDRRWIFFIISIVGVPLFVALVIQPRVFSVRYILVAIVSVYWLFSIHTAFLLSGTLRGHFLLPSLIAISLVTGNMYHNIQLLMYGRGRPAAAVSHIAKYSTSKLAVIRSDIDFRTLMVLSFYWPREANVNYHYLRNDEPGDAEWYLKQTRDDFEPIVFSFCEDHVCYCFRVRFPYVVESGWEWRIFSRCESKELVNTRDREYSSIDRDDSRPDSENSNSSENSENVEELPVEKMPGEENSEI